MIAFRRATKLYGTVIGVNDVTLSLPQGAYGLIGPNGSGKSTLLNLMTGQLRPTLGEVRVFGENPCNNPEVLRRLGVCPEQDSVYADVSGLEWVAYLLQLHGFGRRAARQRAAQRVELGELDLAAQRRRRGGVARRQTAAQLGLVEPDQPGRLAQAQRAQPLAPGGAVVDLDDALLDRLAGVREVGEARRQPVDVHGSPPPRRRAA